MKQQARLLSLLTATFLSAAAVGQDLHFSQFMNSPLNTNPANTGFMPEGDYRLGINYRDQWSSVMSVLSLPLEAGQVLSGGRQAGKVYPERS